jgi:hypothetical protein
LIHSCGIPLTSVLSLVGERGVYMSPGVRGLFKDRHSRDYVKFRGEILKWKKSLAGVSEKNLYLMKKDPLLFTLVKVSIVKLPRSGSRPTARRQNTSVSAKLSALLHIHHLVKR